MDKACKSSADLPAGSARRQVLSGERASNACLIYLRDRDNLGKLGLIPDTLPCRMAGEERCLFRKGRCRPEMGARPIR